MAWDEEENPAIRKARLFLAPPHVVYEELASYGAWLARTHRMYRDDELELHLLTRGERLVNLALAQWGACADVVVTLYAAACSGSSGDDAFDRGMRMAAISNRVCEGVLTGMFGSSAMPAATEVVARNDAAEIKAMLTNPLHRALLILLYQGKAPFDSLDERSYGFLVGYTAVNPALNVDTTNEHGPDLTAWDLQDALWGLVRTGPLNGFMARALHDVLMNLEPRRAKVASSLSDIEQALKRWASIKVLGYRDEEEKGYYTDLSFSQELCVLIAAQYGKAYADKQMQYYGDLDSENIFKRVAHYGNASMKPEQMEAAQSRDGQVFTLAALLNEDALRDNRQRVVLEQGIRGDLQWFYARRCQRMAERYKWFKASPISEDLALEEEKASVPPVAEAAQVNALAARLEKALKDLDTLKGWVFWGLLLVAGLVLYFR